MSMKNFCIVGMGLFAASCGTKANTNDNKDTAGAASPSAQATAALFADANAQNELASGNASEGLNNALAGESSESSMAASLADSGASPLKSFTRKCEVVDGAAVVTLESSVDRSFTLDRKNVSLTKTDKGSGSQIRTWKKEGGSVACNDNALSAKIDWSKVEGLSLSVNTKRSRENSISQVNKRKNATNSHSSSYSLDGSRTVKWISESSDANQIVRNKSVESNVSRSVSFQNSKGESLTTSMSIKTKEGAPLLIEVVRAPVAPFSLKSKTIHSGSVVSSLKEGGSVQSDFSELKFEVDPDSHECSAVSGNFSVAFMAADGAQSEKLTCAAEDGELSCKDLAGNAKDVTPPSCDPEDLN